MTSSKLNIVSTSPRRRRLQTSASSSCEASAESNDERADSDSQAAKEGDQEENYVRGIAQNIPLPAISTTDLSSRKGTNSSLNNNNMTSEPRQLDVPSSSDTDAGGRDSTTPYDGDISSSAIPNDIVGPRKTSHGHHHHMRPSQLRQETDSSDKASMDVDETNSLLSSNEPAPVGFLSSITPAQMQERVLASIESGMGFDGLPRPYRINHPPSGRPIRIYADGVFDLFHLGHALALRQAKLMFQNVYLMVGVNSDELVKQHKSIPVMSSQERYESVRNCKWCDEVVEDAPWVIDQAFIDKHKIDYVAHDEEPYASSDGSSTDVYDFVKNQGKFLPTRRTSGISTSELLSRIVEGYRDGDFDPKLIKIGHPELASRTASRSSRRSDPEDN